MRVRIDQIIPDPNQPRKTFDGEAIKGLASSFESYGVISPLKVRPCGDNQYMIITGELRYRATKQRGDKEIEVGDPIEVTDQQAREMQFIENLDRTEVPEDELGQAFLDYCETYKISGTELARRISKSQPFVTERIALLKKASNNIIIALRRGELQSSEAAHIATIPDEKRQEELAQPFINGQVSSKHAAKVAEIARKEPDRPVEDIIEEVITGKVQEREIAQLEAAKRAAGITIETPEELGRAADALKKEAKRKAKEALTPEEKAEEEREKLVAEARKSLDSTVKKIDHASQFMDVGEFRERLGNIEQSLEEEPTEARSQLVTLGQEVKEAEERAKAEAKRLRDEEQTRKKAEEDQKREERAEKKARKQLLEDPTFLGEVLDKAPKELIEEKVFTEEERETISKPLKPTTIMDQFYELEKQSKKLSDGLAELTEFPPMGRALLGIALQTLRARIDETLERMGVEVIEGEAKLIGGD